MACGAQAILTDNLRDFRGAALSNSGIRVARPADFLIEVAADEPSLVLLALGEMATRKTHPPMTVHDILVALDRRADLATFTAWATPPPTQPA